MNEQAMSIGEMNDCIRSFPGLESGKGATDDQIDSVAESLRVKLSDSYRRFLSIFGWAKFTHQELYGLGSDVPPHLDLMKNTLAERTEMRPALPTVLVPVMNDGAGNHYCLDTSMMADGECPIVFWDHEQPAEQVPDRVAPSFDHMIIDLLGELSSKTIRG